MNLVLKIKRRSQCEWAILYAIFLPFTFGLLIDGFGLSSIVKYTIDIAWLFLLFMIIGTRIVLQNQEIKKLFRITMLFLVTTWFGTIVALQSPLYYLWGFRNNFRFFILFFACIMFIQHKNTEGYLRIFDALFYINFPVCLIQFFIMGYRQDYLGGIFGVHKGCNGTLLVFFSIVIAKSVLRCMNHKESFLLCCLKCFMALLIAVFAELKVFFVVLLLIISISSLMTEFSIKKCIFILIAMIAVVTAVRLLGSLFSYFANWFNLERIFETVTSTSGYAGTGDLNRLTGVPIIWKRFLTTGWKRIFGLGLGNCDTSAFSIVNTPFYVRYGYLHYNWFSAAIMFLETGIAGLLCYCTFFVQVFFQSLKVYRANKERKIECQLAQILAIISLLIIVYNSSLRTEAGYMMFFVLALPFIQNRKLENLMV